MPYPLGDLDGDGIPELAVSAPGDGDGGAGDANRGAVYILFLEASGNIVGDTKISDTAGGFTGAFSDGLFWGTDLASLGDLDGDGNPDLAVGSNLDDTAGTDRGAVWILFLDANGNVKSHQQITDGVGGFTGGLEDGDQFGVTLARMGDLDGDGVVDLAVGARLDDSGGSDRGATWVLFLNTDGTVKTWTAISDASDGFGGRLDDSDWLGRGLASPGDLDGGTLELGAYWAFQIAGVPAVCGDGVLSAIEECDDADVIEVNGCNTNCEIVPVPEPGQLAMLLSGIALLRVLQRRREGKG